MAVPAWTPTDPVEKMPNFQPPINWCPAPPKIVSTDVFPYQANEVAISHTEAGHLTPDVVLTGAAASNSFMPIPSYTRLLCGLETYQDSDIA
jgi:hypothetical protein